MYASCIFNGHHAILEVIDFDTAKKTARVWISNKPAESKSVYYDDLFLSTGEYDKCRKEIIDGDVVWAYILGEDHNGEEVKKIKMVVVWSNAGFILQPYAGYKPTNNYNPLWDEVKVIREEHTSALPF